MRQVCGIYKILNLVNGKIYIGQSVDILNRRWPYHIYCLNSGNHYNKHLQYAWVKYGEKNFEFTIVEECSEDQLDIKEMYYIDLYKSYIPEFGYNKTLGGEGGRATEETKVKMSESHKGLLGTPESRAKQSLKLSGENNPMYGRTGVLSPVFGRQKTDDEIQKIKDSWTVERRQKQSQRISGVNNPMTERTGGQNPSAHKVVCINTGEVFDTIKSAAQWAGLKNHTNIIYVCNGERKHAGRHPITGEKLSWKNYDTINQ